jgi:hypothetical protein
MSVSEQSQTGSSWIALVVFGMEQSSVAAGLTGRKILRNDSWRLPGRLERIGEVLGEMQGAGMPLLVL